MCGFDLSANQTLSNVSELCENTSQPEVHHGREFKNRMDHAHL
ncbi:hypothetical protein BC777_1343 [Yoonia maricola]|uniref:Uncharacterized protein n=1 Tax=Yoonia maricola TaxID=420999 RepID=A0A2M8WNJ6_9RHOB|nr:hypothetical protein BC777_1343 [Yoonia maricola]